MKGKGAPRSELTPIFSRCEIKESFNASTIEELHSDLLRAVACGSIAAFLDFRHHKDLTFWASGSMQKR